MAERHPGGVLTLKGVAEPGRGETDEEREGGREGGGMRRRTILIPATINTNGTSYRPGYKVMSLFGGRSPVMT